MVKQKVNRGLDLKTEWLNDYQYRVNKNLYTIKGKSSFILPFSRVRLIVEVLEVERLAKESEVSRNLGEKELQVKLKLFGVTEDTRKVKAFFKTPAANFLLMKNLLKKFLKEYVNSEKRVKLNFFNDNYHVVKIFVQKNPSSSSKEKEILVTIYDSKRDVSDELEISRLDLEILVEIFESVSQSLFLYSGAGVFEPSKVEEKPADKLNLEVLLKPLVRETLEKELEKIFNKVLKELSTTLVDKISRKVKEDLTEELHLFEKELLVKLTNSNFKTGVEEEENQVEKSDLLDEFSEFLERSGIEVESTAETLESTESEEEVFYDVFEEVNNLKKEYLAHGLDLELPEGFNLNDYLAKKKYLYTSEELFTRALNNLIQTVESGQVPEEEFDLLVKVFESTFQTKAFYLDEEANLIPGVYNSDFSFLVSEILKKGDEEFLKFNLKLFYELSAPSFQDLIDSQALYRLSKEIPYQSLEISYKPEFTLDKRLQERLAHRLTKNLAYRQFVVDLFTLEDFELALYDLEVVFQ